MVGKAIDPQGEEAKMSESRLRADVLDFIGWLEAASSPDEPKIGVTGKVSAEVTASRLREILDRGHEPAVATTDGRIAVAAQAMNDYWIPMRGRPSQYDECDYGQAAYALNASDAMLLSDEWIEASAKRYYEAQSRQLKYQHCPEWEQVMPSLQAPIRDRVRRMAQALLAVPGD
jgi:hypothetical protein